MRAVPLASGAVNVNVPTAASGEARQERFQRAARSEITMLAGQNSPLAHSLKTLIEDPSESAHSPTRI